MSGKWKEVSPSAWDNALNLLQGGTFFDTAKWQQCFSWKTQHIIYLHYSIDNKIIAGISAGIEKIGNTYIIKSPFTAPFGGLLIKKNIHISQLLCIISELKIFFSKMFGYNYQFIYIQRSHIISPSSTYDAQEFSLKYSGFQEKEIFYEMVVQVREKIELAERTKTVLNKIKREQRMSFQKATVEEFIQFRRKVVAQQNKIITVPDDEIRMGYDLYPNFINFWKIVQDDTILAILLADGLHQDVHVGRNWFMDINYPKSNATLFLLYSWFQHLYLNNVKYASLGSTLQTSSHSNNNTLQFKERFLPSISCMKKVFTLDYNLINKIFI